MKKLLLILSFIVAALTASAQSWDAYYGYIPQDSILGLDSVQILVIDAEDDSTFVLLLSQLDALWEGELVNEAGLYSALSDVTQFVEAGDTLFIRGGEYFPTIGAKLHPDEDIGYNGTEENNIYYLAYPGETPVFNCENVEPEAGYINYGIDLLYAEHIYFKGLIIKNLYGRTNPILATGINASDCANLTFENMTFHDISGRGVFYTSGVWPEWRYGAIGILGDGVDTTSFINCDFYNLCDTVSDTPGNAADGIFGQCFTGGYILIENCRFWNYTDDGIDLSGDGKKIVKNSWFMASNRYASMNNEFNESNGMKLSAPMYEDSIQSSEVMTIVTNCTGLFCLGRPFYTDIFKNYVSYFNSNAQIYNNTAYYSGYAGFEEIGLLGNERSNIYRNNIAWKAQRAESGYDPVYEVAIYSPSVYTESNNTWDATQELNGWPGWTYSVENVVSDDDFVTVDSLTLVGIFTAPRDANGNLPAVRPLQLSPDSDLIDAGIDVGLSYYGSAPDIGAFEFGEPEPTPTTTVSSASFGGNPLTDGGKVLIFKP